MFVIASRLIRRVRRELRIQCVQAACVLVGWMLIGTPKADAELTAILPAGACRGSQVTVQLQGEFPEWPVTMVCQHPDIQWEPVSDAKGTVKVTVPEHVIPGGYWVRTVGSKSASRARRFWVSTVRELQEASGAPDEPAEAIDLAQPCVVNGRLSKNDEVDVVAVCLKKDQVLAVEVQAHRLLGSPMDTVLQVVDATHNVVLDQIDDAVGLDPRLEFTAPHDGTYELRLFAFPVTPDSRVGFSGGNSFVYRLLLSTAGILRAARPLAIGEPAAVETLVPVWQGQGGEGPLERVEMGDAFSRYVRVFRNGIPGVATVPVVAKAIPLDRVEDAPDARPAETPSVEGDRPLIVTGCLRPGEKSDTIRISAAAGSQLRVNIVARELDFPLDPVLTIQDDQQQQLARVDDVGQNRDVSTTVTVPESGELQLVIEDLHGRSGASFLYRATIESIVPRLTLTVADEVFAVKVGEPLSIKVAVNRLDGFTSELEITTLGLPAGTLGSSARSIPGTDSEKEVTLTIQATGAAHGPFRVIAASPSSREYIRATSASTIQGETHDSFYVVARPE